MKHRIAAIVCAWALTFTPVWAGPKAVERPLPTQFFSDKTIMLTQIDVNALSSQRIYQAVNAIIPDEYRDDIDIDTLPGKLAMVDGIAMQLKSINVDRLTVIAVTSDPTKLTSASAYALAPVGFDATDEQKAQAIGILTGLGQMGNMKATTIPGWVVLHAGEALPEVDELAIEDAAFNDALTVNPDHDLSIIIVPTPDMRKQMASHMSASLANATPEEREALQHVGVLTESEWYYISLVLGPQPQLRIATKASSAAKAQQFSRALGAMLREGKAQIKKEMEEQLAEAKKKKAEKDIDYDPEDFDPRPMMEVMDAFVSEPEDQTMVIDMDRDRLKHVVYGICKIAEGIGEAVAGAMVAPMGVE